MSLQNSRDVSSLQVTMNGNQIEIDPFGNGTNPIDDVKVLLLKGEPGGVIDQQQSDWNQTNTSAVDYIKNKPTLGTASALDVPSSGNASTSEVVKGDDTRLTDARPANGGTANKVSNALTITDEGGSSETYDGSAAKTLKFRSALAVVQSVSWSSTVDADGYYTLTTFISGSMDGSAPFFVECISSDGQTPASASEKAAYNLCSIFNLADQRGANVLTVKAKTKPTTTFYVRLIGVDY